jgi:Tfp pilus assembly protein PilV
MKRLAMDRFRRRPRRTGPGPARGVGLVDALIALAILAFGLLALTRFQGRLVTQTTEVQARSTALLWADELLATALVDAENRACYTVPAAGVCANANAAARAAAWAASATAALPGSTTAAATLSVDNRLTVRLTWTGKDSGEERMLEATTDVTPVP